jgi:predicted alpha/beta hydrolase
MAAYSRAPYQARTIDCAVPIGAIGHMGYFRPKAQALWDDTLNWFAELQAQAKPA